MEVTKGGECNILHLLRLPLSVPEYLTVHATGTKKTDFLYF